MLCHILLQFKTKKDLNTKPIKMVKNAPFNKHRAPTISTLNQVGA